MKITVTVKPNSKKPPHVETRDDGSLIACVREVAADGKANEALIKMLAEYYGVAKTRVSIIRGHTSRRKVVEILDVANIPVR